MMRDIQAGHLTSLGASAVEIEELLAYNDNAFDLSALEPGMALPLPDEPFVAVWEGWAEEARERGAFTVLREKLPQLCFPIRAGISETEAYRATTRKGIPSENLPEATGLELEHPDRIELVIYRSPAGRIPLLITRGRGEFVALLQALTRRNEPWTVPDAQGALMVSGYNNWERIRSLRKRWESLPPEERETSTWSEEFARITPQKELYQDRFILLSDGPYSAVPAADLGLDEARWREVSLVIRRDHECAHYFTRRLFGSMRNNLLDELIADDAGMVAAIGRFRADWFLRFLGVAPGGYRPGGRLDIYRGDPPLSDGAFRVLQVLIARAAENLESFDFGREGTRGVVERALRIAVLASLRLEDLASPEASLLLGRKVEELCERLDW